jgi:hypothetical protein
MRVNHSIFRSGGLLALFLIYHLVSFGQEKTEAKDQPGIQDNSFLIEEAYNQEAGVVQHISTFSRMWNSRDWSYTFTQEWPGLHNPRNQYSYTLIGMHSGEFGSAGVGDVIFNYRYQAVGNGESRVAFAPRVSMLLPSGDVAHGRGLGGIGIQFELPVSIVLTRRLVTHWNAGGMFVPRAQGPDHSRATSFGYNLGQSVVFIAHPRVNFIVETAYSQFQSVVQPGATEWSPSLLISPGIRWAYNYKNGLQIVPGLAFPIGLGPTAGEKGVFAYLSLEHPFGKSRH